MTAPAPIGALAVVPANAPQDPTTAALFAGLFSTLRVWTQRVAGLLNGMISGQISGTTTNDNAVAGNIGEEPFANVASGSAVSLTTATPATIASLTLSPGDWDVTGIGCFNQTAVTPNSQGFSIGISTVNNNLPSNTDGLPDFVQLPGNSGPAPVRILVPVGPIRQSLAGSTTFYLVAQAFFTTGASTVGGYGTIRARRIR